ncbi:MAG: hypothetical protein AAFO63_01655 [Pseudomonadota bacterium]
MVALLGASSSLMKPLEMAYLSFLTAHLVGPATLQHAAFAEMDHLNVVNADASIGQDREGRMRKDSDELIADRERVLRPMRA